MASLRNISKYLSPKRFRMRDLLMLSIGAILASGVLAAVALIGKDHVVPLEPESSTITAPWIPPTVKHWEGTIDEMAKKYEVDPNLIAIIMTIESGGYTKAESGAGAKGLMQITPPTAQDIAAKHLKKLSKSYDLADPHTSIEFGTAYLAALRDKFGERTQGPSWNVTAELVAAGYNGGPGAAGKLYRGEGLTSIETVSYSRDVYNMWRERHAKTSPTFDRWLGRGGSRLIDRAKAEQQQ